MLEIARHPHALIEGWEGVDVNLEPASVVVELEPDGTLAVTAELDDAARLQIKIPPARIDEFRLAEAALYVHAKKAERSA